MPYLITTATYPSDRAPDVAKMYLEAMAVAEIKEGKLEEAYKRIVNLEAMFINIEGYEYTIDTYLKVEEALAVIGMSIPE